MSLINSQSNATSIARRLSNKAELILQRFNKFFDLPAAHQRMMLHTLLLVIAFRLGLYVIPYRLLQRIADRAAARRIASANEPMRIAHDITAMSRYIPGATCLTQALVAQVLLQRDGFSPKMCIGVARGEGGEFKAHAWIELDGRIIVGDLGPGMIFTTMQQVR
ncbi:MAG TPA: lasso peptide biosynthesis B2 protein [Tepidisphaeraceae bacterium]|nr:lasso peptide biosynthesis B2 protein [Tepidisphaeraceae bacterium]